MLRRITNPAIIFALVVGALLVFIPEAARADEKNYTAEQIVETTIIYYGSRPGLAQIRRNGWERGKITSIGEDGRPEEGTYERRFIRGESLEKDRVRLDQKTPKLEYSLVYGNGKTWGLINGAAFTPREDASSNFLSQLWHDIDALLRYKENGSQINLLGKDKQQNIDLYIIELTDKEKRRTRFYISQKSFRVLWLEYDESATPGAAPIKYVRKFYDYQYIQGTLVPKRTVLFEDGKQTQETRLLSVTYGIKMEDTIFKNPDELSSTPQP